VTFIFFILYIAWIGTPGEFRFKIKSEKKNHLDYLGGLHELAGGRDRSIVRPVGNNQDSDWRPVPSIQVT
jgi:hypothetical protein